MSGPAAAWPRAYRLAPLLAVSGFCALLYQTVWLRSFRAIFGASTPASAAVLAIFMGGLGVGSLWLGRRADRARSPLAFYARLELGIAVSAGLSPWLIALAQALYVATGGSANLGSGASTLVRLALATLVLAVPTVLMGGTLPAIARAVSSDGDPGRRAIGHLYAVNTLGGVAGVLCATFWSVEHLGLRRTELVAALLNVLVALVARSLARGEAEPASPAPQVAVGGPDEGAPRTALVVACAATVGFVFLLMEQCWYRMLAPLLGGSSYTFGLILALALFGIGLGGLVYGRGAAARRPTLTAFAATCALEALLVIVPFALGDRVAVLAALLRNLSALGFVGLLGGWAVVAGIVVVGPAFVAGYQFPLLIARLGRTGGAVGSEVGAAYGANTAGAIAGSLAGGFGLLPLLSAPGVWRLSTFLLAALALLVLVVERDRAVSRRLALAGTAAIALLALALTTALGPSAFWRHSAIGAGRLQTSDWDRPNALRSAVQATRRSVVWERDGVESAVALDLLDSYAFIVNGKSDGSAFGDAPMQVMSGLIGTALHPNPRRALVIGLGTGSTAGWMASVPTMERVDVVELEPQVRHVAEVLRGVNRDVLRAPNVRLSIGDGREFLLTTDDTYDVIFSEPSNPYRAGVAGLFSADFYRAVRRRLNPGGIFLQWLQGYETDSSVVETAYATLSSAFPAIESWLPHRNDLLLVASAEPLVHDADRVRVRMRGEPYASALRITWGVEDAEGFYSGFLASPALARALAGAYLGPLNTDDRPVIEFGFARNLGRGGLFDVRQIPRLARVAGADAVLAHGALDTARLAEMRSARALFWGNPPFDPPPTEPEAAARALARSVGATDDLGGACRSWLSQSRAADSHADRLLLATCLAISGDARAEAAIARLAGDQPIEAEIAGALLDAASGRQAEATDALLRAFAGLRRDPWVHSTLAARALALANLLARSDAGRATRLLESLAEPFASGRFEAGRLRARLDIAIQTRSLASCRSVLAPFEAHPLWERNALAFRVFCYRALGAPELAEAERDYATFEDGEPPQLATPEMAPAARPR